MLKIEFVYVDRCEYAQALATMNDYHERVAQKSHHPVIIVTEHEPVITMGNRKLHTDLLFVPETRTQYFEIDRGGSATAHEPGQLVVYPILPSELFDRSVRNYVTLLEKSVIATAKHFEINASCVSEFPGVWVQNKKVAAVGVRIKDHVTKHGLAFNITNNLSTFESIVPCGIRERSVTSMYIEYRDHQTKKQELNLLSEPEFYKAVKRVFVQNLKDSIAQKNGNIAIEFLESTLEASG